MTTAVLPLPIITEAYTQVHNILGTTQNENDKIEQIRTLVKTTLDAAQVRLDAQADLISELTTNKGLQDQAVQEAIKSRNLLREQVTECEGVLKKLNEKTVPLIEQFAALDSRYKMLAAEAEARVRKQIVVDASIETLGTQTRDLTNHTHKLNTEFQTLHSTVEAQKDKTVSLEGKSAQFLKECADLQAALKEIDAQTLALHEKSAKLTAKSESLQGAFNGLKGHTEGLQDVTIKMKREYDDLQTTYVSLNGETTRLKTRFDAISEKYNGLKTHYNQLGDATQDLKNHYNAISKDYDLLNGKFSNLGTETQNLKKVTEQMKNDYLVLKDQFITYRNRTEELENQVDNLNLVNERKVIIRARDRVVKPLSNFVGTASLSAYLWTSLPVLNAVFYAYITYRIALLLGREAVKYYRAYKLAQLEEEYLIQNPKASQRQAFEYAKAESESLRGHPFFKLIWN